MQDFMVHVSVGVTAKTNKALFCVLSEQFRRLPGPSLSQDQNRDQNLDQNQDQNLVLSQDLFSSKRSVIKKFCIVDVSGILLLSRKVSSVNNKDYFRVHC